MILRDLQKMNTMNDGTRTLVESIMLPEVIKALEDWNKATGLMNIEAVLIGGVALSHWVKPRMTQDIDFLFMSIDKIPDVVPGFKRTRPGAFQHNSTHVEVEVVIPKSVNLPTIIVQEIFSTSIIDGGVRVASPSGLVASKIFRLIARDRADIIDLVKTGRVDLSGFSLSQEQLAAFEALRAEAKSEFDLLGY